MASPGNSGDVSSTLGELERKLRELEQELARVGHPAATPPAPLVPPPATPIASVPEPAPQAPGIAAVPEPPAPPTPAAPAGASEQTDDRLSALEEQLDALRSYGAELQASAGRLLEAYRRALAEAERPATVPAPPVPTPPIPSAPQAAAAAPPVPPAPAPEPAVRAPIQDQRSQDEIMARFIAAQQAASTPAAHHAAEAPAMPGPPAPEVAPPAPAFPPALPSVPAAAVPPAPTGPVYVNLPGTIPVEPADPTPTPIPTPQEQSVPAAVAPHAVGALDQRYVGAVTVDAGPFHDITSLSAFEQAIARVPGVRDVYVRGFQGQRAVIDVDFGTPTALVSELAAVTTVPFIVDRADATGLVVTIPPVSPDAS